MGKMKSLAEKLREAVKHSIPAEPDEKRPFQKTTELEKSTISNTRKEVKKYSKTGHHEEGVGKDMDISKRINQLSFNRETKKPKQVPIRFPATLYSRLRLLGEEASIQKITVYAVNQFIESDEVKNKIKSILKNLNE